MATMTLWILRRRMSVRAYFTLESGSTTTTGLDIQSRTVLGMGSSSEICVFAGWAAPTLQFNLFYNQFHRIHCQERSIRGAQILHFDPDNGTRQNIPQRNDDIKCTGCARLGRRNRNGPRRKLDARDIKNAIDKVVLERSNGNIAFDRDRSKYFCPM